jgi:hypothetical protein
VKVLLNGFQVETAAFGSAFCILDLVTFVITSYSS